MTRSARGAAEVLDRLREEAAGCRNCGLWRDAEQTVFGEGPVPAPLMLVGEQPGDQEDRQGHVFVGPAGRVLDRALADAGIDRSDVYLTNAVKHFKWKPRGKRRIHDTPNRSEVLACHPWLEQELKVVSPRVLVVMGSVAARAVLGAGVKVGADRGEDLTDTGLAPHVVVTAHPSSVLRVPRGEHGEETDAARALLVRDFARAATLLEG